MRLPRSKRRSWQSCWVLASRSITEAKAVLRAKGGEGPGLASRLGRLSRLRNGRCHPDVGFRGDLGAFLGVPGEAAQQTVLKDQVCSGLEVKLGTKCEGSQSAWASSASWLRASSVRPSLMRA